MAIKYVGRDKQVKHLQEFIKFKKVDDSPSLMILSIDGPGGVGKSTLISMAEASINYNKLNALRLYIDASESMESILDVVNKILKSVKYEAANRYSRDNIVMVKTESALEAADEIYKDACKEMSGKIDPQVIYSGYKKLISLGKSLNNFSKKSKEYVDFCKLESTSDGVKNIADIIAFNNEYPNFLEKLGVYSESKKLRNKLRTNALDEFSVSLKKDLDIILAGYDLKDITKPLPEKISGCDRLIMFIDDYEKINSVTDGFVVKYLLPALSKAKFQVSVIISGRDELTATDSEWDQHFKANMADPIDLGPLSKSEIKEIAIAENVDPDALWKDTGGYPYFIQLWIESRNRGGETVISLKKFYERTTKWMTDEQKKWLDSCIFIDKINLDTLEDFMGSSEEAENVLNWFKNEASIRDTKTRWFSVRSYIRIRLKDYLEINSPRKFAMLNEKAKIVNKKVKNKRL